MRLLLISLFLSLSLFAEATFDQVQTMIERHDYKQAKLALHIIVYNHPTSAKAYYTLAQATAGLGDLPAAREAIDRATALDPHLSFAPPSAVASLRDALTPPTAKIIPIQQSHTFLYIVLATLGFTGLYYYFFRRPKAAPAAEPTPTRKYEPGSPSTSTSYRSTTRYTPPARDTYSTYSDPTPSRSTEVHHHHHDSSSSRGMSTLGTVAVAGVTAAAVAALMDDDEPSRPSHSYEPTPSVSSSWEDTSSTSSSWEEPTTRSSSWESSSSSSSSGSWSSSSDSSSSSWD